MKNRFELTPEGYQKAVEYLKSIDKYKSLSDHDKSNGFSLTHAANYIYRKRNNEST